MIHIFQKGTDSNAPVFLLLHGTGGTENDLIPIAEMIDPSASILGVRGNVLENGMPRFFRRLREGVFDEEDLIARTEELHLFLDEAASKYGFARNQLIAVGYSNGANIAGSLLFHYEDALQTAILFHPMVPRRNIDLPNLQDKKIFIGAGQNDPLISEQETTELHSIFTKSGADVTLHWENYGHQLSKPEVDAARKWYNEHMNK